MPVVEPFERFTERYEEWFTKHEKAYISEINAIKKVLPSGKTIEIGTGTGRFSIPFNINYGVEPSLKMAVIAKCRGINVVRGVAEALPLKNNSFDNVLMVTTVCFVDDIEKSFLEVKRILKKNGSFVIGFIDKNSKLGRFYLKHKEENPFYRYAKFYSTEEILFLLRETGFTVKEIYQTVFRLLSEIKQVEPVKEGYGEGAFVVVRGEV